MSLPPWYRPQKRPLAEAVLSLNLSCASGIGPLFPGMSVRWDMTPLLCLSDPSYRVRVTVDSDGQRMDVTQRHSHIATLSLARDTKRIGSPLRAICPMCGRLTFRLYMYWTGSFRCGYCLRVAYASGRRDVGYRASARMQRLEQRLYCTQWLPRNRGRRKIQAEIARQDGRWLGCMPTRLRRYLAEFL